MKLVKWLFFGGIALLTFSVLALFVLITLVDANALKPVLKQHLAKQGLRLEAPGDFDWRFYPYFGISLGQSTIYPAEQSTELASIEAFYFSLSPLPLLQKKLHISSLRLDGLTLNYQIDKAGLSNIDFLLAQTDSPKKREVTEEREATPANVELTIEEILITRSQARYQDQRTDKALAISINRLAIQQVNTKGRDMPLTLEAGIEAALASPLTLELEGVAGLSAEPWRLDLQLNQYQVQAGNARASGSLNLNAEKNLTNLEFNLLSPSLGAWLKLVDPQFTETMPEHLLQQAQASVSAEIKSQDQIDSRLDFRIDDSTLTAELNAKLKDNSMPAVRGSVSFDSLNLDAYLPPAEAEETRAQSPASPAKALPLELVNELDLELELQGDSITYRGLKIEQINSHISAERGRIEQELKASVAEGSISGMALLQARAQRTELQGKVDISDLELKPLLEKVADFDNLSGAMNSSAQFSSRGLTSRDLSKNFQLSADTRSSEVQFSPVNMTKLFCQTIALVEGRALEKSEWKSFTQISPIRFTTGYSANKVQVSDFDGLIENLNTSASGSIKLSTGDFNFPFQLKLTQVQDAVEACGKIESRWLDRIVPLRCKGNINSIGIDTCLPDQDFIKQQVKARLDSKLEKEKDKLEQRAEEELKKTLEKHIDEAELEALKGLFK